jgi:hypothetical protein
MALPGRAVPKSYYFLRFLEPSCVSEGYQSSHEPQDTKDTQGTQNTQDSQAKRVR